MRKPVEGGKGYTYADYLTWNDGKRWEIIDGVAYEKNEGVYSFVSDMSPAPGRYHQAIVSNLIREIGIYLKGKEGRVFPAPFDVTLTESGIVNIVQPDLSIFLNNENLDERGATGAPDWVIEILSPYTSSKDLGTKKLLYQKFKVREYWIVDPVKKVVSVFILNKENSYDHGNVFSQRDKVNSNTFPDLEINFSEIFAD